MRNTTTTKPCYKKENAYYMELGRLQKVLLDEVDLWWGALSEYLVPDYNNFLPE